MSKTRRIEVIRTDRFYDMAYIAIYSKWPSDDPDDCGNWQMSLARLEALLGQHFDDGEHDFIKFDVDADAILAAYRRTE